MHLLTFSHSHFIFAVFQLMLINGPTHGDRSLTMMSMAIMLRLAMVCWLTNGHQNKNMVNVLILLVALIIAQC